MLCDDDPLYAEDTEVASWCGVLRLVKLDPRISNTVKKCFASCAALWSGGPTVCLSNRVVVQCEAGEVTLWAGGELQSVS